jgi:hypothetical protein
MKKQNRKMKQIFYEGSIGIIPYHSNIVDPRSTVEAKFGNKDKVTKTRRANERNCLYSSSISLHHFKLRKDFRAESEIDDLFIQI